MLQLRPLYLINLRSSSISEYVSWIHVEWVGAFSVSLCSKTYSRFNLWVNKQFVLLRIIISANFTVFSGVKVGQLRATIAKEVAKRMLDLLLFKKKNAESEKRHFFINHFPAREGSDYWFWSSPLPARVWCLVGILIISF